MMPQTLCCDLVTDKQSTSMSDFSYFKNILKWKRISIEVNFKSHFIIIIFFFSNIEHVQLYLRIKNVFKNVCTKLELLH